MSENEVVDTRHEQAVESLEDGEALMMWLVDKKKFQQSVERGITYFESKYGLKPNIIIAHPDDVILKDGTILENINGLIVATTKACLTSHALIGIVAGADSVWGVQP